LELKKTFILKEIFILLAFRINGFIGLLPFGFERLFFLGGWGGWLCRELKILNPIKGQEGFNFDTLLNVLQHITNLIPL